MNYNRRIFMESKELNENELTYLIRYGIKKNNINIGNIDFSIIEKIISNYYVLCNYVKVAYIRGELDTFKMAACLLVTINKNQIVSDKKTNASIALDTAYKMCQKPYWNVGEEFNIPKKLEEVEFNKVFEEDTYLYDKSKEMLIDSLIYENGDPLSYSLNLELLYQIALEMKHNKMSDSAEKNISDSQLVKNRSK